MRPVCPICRRPPGHGLCGLAVPTPNEVELLVLQHPLERDQAKGSARLLALSLQRCRLEVGEAFEAGRLAEWLQEGGRVPLLLYPLAAPQASDARTAAALALPPGRLRLVVLDGTWRKSRRMLALHPALQALPRLALQAPPPSRYAIRKAQAGHQRSTLEASCLALQQIEGQPRRYAPLLQAFDAFIGRWAAASAASGPA